MGDLAQYSAFVRDQGSSVDTFCLVRVHGIRQILRNFSGGMHHCVDIAGMQESKFIEQLESPQEQKRARIQMEFEKDCLLQWMMLVFLTLHELGIPQVPSPFGPVTPPLSHLSSPEQIPPLLSAQQDGVKFFPHKAQT